MSIEIFSRDLIDMWLREISPQLLENVTLLEKSETWVKNVSSREFNRQFYRFQVMLLEDQSSLMDALKNSQEQFIQILAYLYTGVALRVLKETGNQSTEYNQQLLIAADALAASDNNSNPALQAASKVFLDRILTLVAADTYHEVFGPERRKSVLVILKKIKENSE